MEADNHHYVALRDGWMLVASLDGHTLPNHSNTLTEEYAILSSSYSSNSLLARKTADIS